MSHARAHFQRASAASAEGPREEQTTGNAYELMLAKLAEDRRRLKSVQSIERKADVKRELLPDYAPWVEGVLASASGRQDDVLMTVMVWRIDTGDVKGALPLAQYAIEHGLVMPDQYQRTTACLIAEEAADMALKAIDTADFDSLVAVLDLTADEDMPDEVRAKLHKAIGYVARQRAGDGDGEASRHDLQNALEHLQRARELHDKVGVKKDIERLEVQLKNSAGTGTAPGAG